MLLSVFTFLFAAALAVLAAQLLSVRAERWGLIDAPGDGRKQHAHPTPLIGGLIIWAGMCALLFIMPSADLFPYCLPLAALTVVVGVLDDRHELSARLRLVVHLGIGLLMIFWADIKLTQLGELYPGKFIYLGLMAIPVTCFAVAAAMNAINMVDGVDGLAGSLTLIPVLVVAVLAALSGYHDLLYTTAALAGGLCVFLLLNFPLPWRHRASCFLGDTGSTLLGFMVAWLLIRSSEAGLMSPVLALFLIALPLLDTAGVMTRRLRRGVSMTTAGRDHLHHVLIDAGISPRQTVYLLVSVAVVIASLGLLMERNGMPQWAMFLFFMSMLLANLYLLRNAENAKSALRERLSSSRS